MSKHQGWTALHFACGSVHPRAWKYVSSLLDAGADITAQTNDSLGKHEPIHVASHVGNESVVALLLERGAHVSAITNDWARSTPLHIASSKGHTFLVEYLLKRGAKIDEKTGGTGCSAIHNSINEFRDSVVELLISKGADIESATNSEGYPDTRHCIGQYTCPRKLFFLMLLENGANAEPDNVSKLYISSDSSQPRSFG